MILLNLEELEKLYSKTDTFIKEALEHEIILRDVYNYAISYLFTMNRS